MGKKRGGHGHAPAAPPRAGNQAVSLREESSGKTRADAASLLRVQHLQRLAAWAGGEAGAGPLGALLGRRLAANAEAAGIPLAASTFLCQRCETVLQPGFNCTIRIKNNKRKAKRRKKLNTCQNSISYLCHFCGDQNLIRGSGKNIMKGLLSSRKPVGMDVTSIKLKGDSNNKRLVTIKEGFEYSQAAVSQLELTSGLKQQNLEKNEYEESPVPNLLDESMEKEVACSSVELNQSASATDQENVSQKIVVTITSEKEFPVGSSFVTPRKNKLVDVTDHKDSAELVKTRSIQNKKGEMPSSVTGKAPTMPTKSAPKDRVKNKSVASGSAQMSGSSRKRARKGWTTLKQIAEKEELERKEKMGNFVIPFFMQ
ncbi:uncharacterized protein LOC127776638 isoform X2 [Oryza glaberrima]|uniref:uncharacterized protein LOC127776638 isoform X2 n=1 Tax=Oryza glaberrima TaxID=4538 RepID=UPI00224C0FDF|nr:uncharacterized protein LOC127776638 isoform X2 [Oryza glaberrima]